MKLSATERLRRFYSLFSGADQVLVMINADPDAIASAMAVKRLLWRKVAGVTLSNVNVIKRPDNLAMIRLLGVNLIHADQIDLSRFTRFVVVDSQPDHHESFQKICPDVIIDHHPITSANAAFVDIRPEYGSTATILTEYLRTARIKPSVKLATGLFHAIKTDTNNFERHTVTEDINAFHFLFRHANIQLARKIEHCDLRYEFLKYFKIALENMKTRKGRLFIHLGPVINGDICVLVADFFMRVNRIQWSIVSGVCDGKLIIIFRNDGLRKNAGKVAKNGFGQIGSAGGHKSAARAEIMLSDLPVNPDDDKSVIKWIMKRIIETKPTKPSRNKE